MKTFTLITALIAAVSFEQNLSAQEKTVADRLEQYGTNARARLAPFFVKAVVAYPPTALAFIGLKEEKTLQIYAKSGTNGFKFIREYPILAASGVAGPKLREGDKQVPEGIYPIEWLNPNSSYHLSMRIGYPNAFDREQAAKDGRTKLGGDIMIHGNAKSVGCLAMGDEAAEEFFVLAADTKIENITVIIAPVDFRAGKTLATDAKLPGWTATLYPQIRSRLAEFPSPTKSP
jgi:murein L,D-transpeptidase YafK